MVIRARRRVFDGVFSHVAGAGKVFANHRFAEIYENEVGPQLGCVYDAGPCGSEVVSQLLTQVGRSFSARVAASLLWWRQRWPNAWGPEPTAALPLASAVSSENILLS